MASASPTAGATLIATTAATARYDAATGLYWLSVRAYDPSLGRFLSRDPLGRVPLFFSDNPYVYAGNNPLSNVDPSGQQMAGASAAQVRQAAKRQAQKLRMYATQGHGVGCDISCKAKHVRSDAVAAMNAFQDALTTLSALALLGTLGGGAAFILTKAALQALLDSVVVKVVGAGLAGIAVPLALAFLALKWEASQSLAWFEHRPNVDGFFTTVEWGMFVIAAIVGISAIANIEAEPVSFVFGITTVLIADGKVNDELEQANREQDREYSRTTP